MTTPRSNVVMVEVPRADPGVRRYAILVLGMHRSGTSALVRLLGLLGADLPKRLMEPNFANRTGYWEPVDIVAVHDDMLAAVGSAWDDAVEFPLDWLDTAAAQPFRVRLRAAFEESFGSSSLAVLKDPRICRFVPLWISILESMGVAPLFVIPIRSPLEVAASLLVREEETAATPLLAQERMPETKALLLWLRHFLDAERHTRGFTRSFVGYEQLLADWRGAVAKIGRDLGVDWPRSTEEAARQVEDFLSRELRHHVSAADTLVVRPDIVPWLKDAFRWAQNAAVGRPEDTGELDRIHAALRLADLTSHVAGEASPTETAHAVAALEQQFAERVEVLAEKLSGEPATTQQEVRPLIADIAAGFGQANQTLVHALGAAGVLRADLARRLEESRLQVAAFLAERDAHRRQLEEMHNEFSQLTGKMLERDHEIAHLSGKMLERDHEIAHLSGEMVQRNAEIARLSGEIARASGEIAQISGQSHRFSEASARKDNEIVCLRERIAEAATTQSALAEAVAAGERLQRENRALKSSTSWRVTEPLRNAKRFSSLVAHQMPRILKIVRRSHSLDRLPALVRLRRNIKLLATSGRFDSDWYLAQYPDVAAAGKNPVRHYLQCGALEGRNPSPTFDTNAYLQDNPDVANAGTNPLLHYIVFGAKEGRQVRGPAKQPITPKGAAQRPRHLTSHLRTASNSSLPPISVVLPTYNRGQLLEETLQCCAACTGGVDVEFVVIDDGSADDTTSMLERLSDIIPNLVWRTVTNGGPGRARNLGVSVASHEVVLFLGDDIQPLDDEFFAVHARLHAANPSNRFAVLGKVVWPESSKINVSFVMSHIQGYGGEQFGYADLIPYTYLDWRHFYTSNLSIKKSLISDWIVDGFHPQFFQAAFEDIELAYRLSKQPAGIAIYYDPTSLARHVHPYTVDSFMSRQVAAGMMAKTFADLHPEVIDSLGIRPLAQALHSPVDRKEEWLAADYLSVVEGIRSWARILEDGGGLGRESWHNDLLFAVFDLCFHHGYLLAQADSLSNVVSGYEYILRRSLQRLRKATHLLTMPSEIMQALSGDIGSQ